MSIALPRLTQPLLLAATLAIAACGGGGGGSSGGSDSGNPGGGTPTVTAPAITTQPQSVTVTAGAAANFSVAASGSAPLSYQWLRNGVAIAGATEAGYSLAKTAAGDNGAQFSVTVSNSAGNVTSAVATLTVTPVVTISISAQPQSTSAVVGGTASFLVAASASGNATPSYQWLRNGADIAGATAASYTTPPLTAADNGALYSVRVSAGNATPVLSAAAALTVNEPPSSRLTISGSISADYRPATATISATAPICDAATCTSSLKLFWTAGAGDQFAVQLTSLNIPLPGAAPGSAVNGIAVTWSGGGGLNYNCVATAGCDLASLGMTLDTAARTLTFSNTTIPNQSVLGQPLVTINGTLRY